MSHKKVALKQIYEEERVGIETSEYDGRIGILPLYHRMVENNV